MSAYVPDSTVTFYKAGVDTDAGRTMLFNTPEARERWFTTKAEVIASEVNCTVIKKRFQTIKSSIPLATIMGCDYLSFINPSYGDRIFYCRITSMDYLNNNVTIVSYEVDQWLTWMFDVTGTGMVVREGLTRGEYTELSKNPYIDNLKMRTSEPLACNDETEPLRYKVAGTNCFASEIGGGSGDVGWTGNDGWNVFAQHDSVYRTELDKYMWDTGISVDHTLPDTEPFYVISFVGTLDLRVVEEHSTIALVSNVFSTMRDYINGSGNPAYLLTTPKLFTITDGPSMTFYAEAKHEDGASLSYSSVPIHDTKQARPYFMVGCKDLTTMKEVVDIFSALDEVSSLLSFYSFPTYLLDEFICNAFDHPDSSLISRGSSYIKLPFPNVTKNIRGAQVDPAYGGRLNEISPKLFRFPYAYATLEGVNESGHIELHYEKMGKTDPMLIGSSGEGYQNMTGTVRLDSEGYPSYYVLQKWVSIQADGIYIGVAPVDYDKRIDGTSDGSTSYITKSNLAKGVFYTDFPQVPFNSDAYLEFLGSAAKNAMVINTEYNRMVQENQFGDIENKRRLAGINAVLGVFSGAGEGIDAAGSSASARVANFRTASDMSRETNSMAMRNNLMTTGASIGTQLAQNGINAAMATRRYNEDLTEMGVQRLITEGAEDYMANPQIANDFTYNYSRTKGAFVSPNYHNGSAGGALNLLPNVEPIGVTLLMRRRSEEYIHWYNEFFKNYGYTTQEYKVPSAFRITHGYLTSDYAPHLEDEVISGAETIGKFYTKTENIRINTVNRDAASYIENMLNGGVLFDVYIYDPS